jgi:hypothetical protein
LRRVILVSFILAQSLLPASFEACAPYNKKRAAVTRRKVFDSISIDVLLLCRADNLFARFTVAKFCFAICVAFFYVFGE